MGWQLHMFSSTEMGGGYCSLCFFSLAASHTKAQLPTATWHDPCFNILVSTLKTQRKPWVYFAPVKWLSVFPVKKPAERQEEAGVGGVDHPQSTPYATGTSPLA